MTLDGEEAPPSELERAVTRELTEVDRLDTVAGQVALELAYRVASPHETGAAVAALAKQFTASLAVALGDVAPAADPLDEIRARRDRKRAQG